MPHSIAPVTAAASLHPCQVHSPASLLPMDKRSGHASFARALRRPSVPRIAPAPSLVLKCSNTKPSLGDAPHPHDPPPDGGRDAWLVVVSSWLVHFVVFGIMYSWGVWQTYYSTSALKASATASQISLIGTVSFSSIFLFGIFAGRLAEWFGYRRTMLCGTISLILGLVLAALCPPDTLWPLVMTQGLMVGFGSSLVYYPSVSIPAQWWHRRRSFVTGIAASGAGVGSVVMTALTDVLLRGGLGHGSTLLAMAVLSWSLLVLAVELVKTRIPKADKKRAFGAMMRSAVDWTQFRNPQFVPLLVAVFFNAFGSLIPFYFLPSYVQFLGLPATLGPALLNTANVGSTLGRILVGLLADAAGNLNTLFLTCAMQSVACLGLWLWVPTPMGLIAFAAMFGGMSGGYIALMPSVTAQVCGVAKLPSSIGLVFSSMMVGHLVGPPVAAALVESPAWAERMRVLWVPAGQYAPMAVFAGTASLVAAAVVGYLRVWVVGGSWRNRQ